MGLLNHTVPIMILLTLTVQEVIDNILVLEATILAEINDAHMYKAWQ